MRGWGRVLLCTQRDQLDCPPPNGLNHYLPLNKTGAHSTGERFRATIALLYMFIATYYCPNGILGLGGKASNNKLKDTNFIFPMSNVTVLCAFHTRAQKECSNVLETKSTSLFNILALLLLEN